MRHEQGGTVVAAAGAAEFLTSADAARILKLTPAGVRLAATDGRLRVAVMTPSGQRLFSRDDVERFKRDRAKGRRVA